MENDGKDWSNNFLRDVHSYPHFSVQTDGEELNDIVYESFAEKVLVVAGRIRSFFGIELIFSIDLLKYTMIDL